MSTLVNRRAELPDFATPPTKTESIKPSTTEKPIDKTTELIKAMADIGVVAEVKGLIHGPRVSRYKVYLPDVNLLDKLRKGLERLSLVLNLPAVPTILAVFAVAITIPSRSILLAIAATAGFRTRSLNISSDRAKS